MDTSVRVMQRLLAAALPGSVGLTDDGVPSLEVRGPAPESPRLVESKVIEGHAMRAPRVPGDPEVGFAAFLDGTQRSRVIHYEQGLPIVHGTVAAVVRSRVNRRMITWAHRPPLVQQRLYVPRAFLPDLWQRLADAGADLGDSSSAPDGGSREAPTRHPISIQERAYGLVQYDRELAEQTLAERWCALEHETLLVDGGISGSERIASAPCTVGVVKSHRTMHADGDALGAVLGLRVRERSSVFRVASSRRTAVASWYLRLRDPAGRDPFWGLVRVEVAETDALRADPAKVTERADRVSRWLLAEVAPLSLPDSRWDKLVYGVHDCETFLRAIC
jgi:hypothetical protein